MTSLFAFLHHVAAFALVAFLVTEFVLIRDELTLASARKLQLADRVYGASAGTVLAIGFLRVIYLEKGTTYYFHSAPFIAKLSLFAIIGLVSIYPTVEFLSWRKGCETGSNPDCQRPQTRIDSDHHSFGGGGSCAHHPLRSADGQGRGICWIN
jgi:putative membrane protein